MCEPTTIVMGVTALIGVATAVYGYQQQKKATKAMAAVQQQEIDSQAQQRTHERMEEARKLRAQARASAAEAGIAGNSVDVLLNDITGQAGRDAALIEVNRQNGVISSDTEARARLRGAKAEMWSQVGSSGSSFATQAVDDYSKRNPQAPPTGG